MRGYERARVWHTRYGDRVRRAGHPLRIGLVLDVRGEDIQVLWSARDDISKATWHHYSTLERRVDEDRAA